MLTVHTYVLLCRGDTCFFFFEEEKKERERERETGSFRSREESKKGNWFGRGRSNINKWRAVCCERWKFDIARLTVLGSSFFFPLFFFSSPPRTFLLFFSRRILGLVDGVYAGNEIGWTVRGILNTAGEFDIACLPFPDSSSPRSPFSVREIRSRDYFA